MRIICAWCKEVIGRIQKFDDNFISHGICQECLKEYLRGIFNESKKIKEKEAKDVRKKES